MSVLSSVVRCSVAAVAAALTAPSASASPDVIRKNPVQILQSVSDAFSGKEVSLSIEDVDRFLQAERIGGLEIYKGLGLQEICGYGFKRLGNPAQRVLLVGFDPGSFRFCQSLTIVGRSAGGFWSQIIPAWEADDIDSLIGVPEGHQRPYLIVPHNLSSWAGGMNCIAVVPNIYDIKSNVVVNVNRQFPEYFERLLLDEPSQNQDACQTMETAKLKSILDKPTDAEVGLALGWLTDPDFNMRDKGLHMLRDINTKRARGALLDIATSNAELAGSALDLLNDPDSDQY